MEDYYKREFEGLHERVGISKVYLEEKLNHAKFDNANESYIKQLEAEYYALQTIWAVSYTHLTLPTSDLV